ncbi:MAG TPA: hypothetical protein VLR90_15200, partial [Blastocatellia bacterium]|nr:hypothetical protein [Blastocatellia bacterium]
MVDFLFIVLISWLIEIRVYSQSYPQAKGRDPFADMRALIDGDSGSGALAGWTEPQEEAASAWALAALKTAGYSTEAG